MSDSNDVLDQKIRDYYEGQSLAPERLASIVETASAVRPNRWLRVVAIAAAVVLFFGVSFIFLLGDKQHSLNHNIATEVVKNVTKDVKPEVMADNWSDIQAYLDRIEFSLVPTREAFLAGYQIVGARYCSVQGELAAQVSLEDEQGKPCLLYVAPLTETLAKSQPGTMKREQVTVQLWHDAHRLYVLAR